MHSISFSTILFIKEERIEKLEKTIVMLSQPHWNAKVANLVADLAKLTVND